MRVRPRRVLFNVLNNGGLRAKCECILLGYHANSKEITCGVGETIGLRKSDGKGLRASSLSWQLFAARKPPAENTPGIMISAKDSFSYLRHRMAIVQQSTSKKS
jgi:hypothetical protein